jgi:hypothetical protein
MIIVKTKKCVSIINMPMDACYKPIHLNAEFNVEENVTDSQSTTAVTERDTEIIGSATVRLKPRTIRINK